MGFTRIKATVIALSAVALLATGCTRDSSRGEAAEAPEPPVPQIADPKTPEELQAVGQALLFAQARIVQNTGVASPVGASANLSLRNQDSGEVVVLAPEPKGDGFASSARVLVAPGAYALSGFTLSSGGVRGAVVAEAPIQIAAGEVVYLGDVRIDLNGAVRQGGGRIAVRRIEVGDRLDIARSELSVQYPDLAAASSARYLSCAVCVAPSASAAPSDEATAPDEATASAEAVSDAPPPQ